MKIAYLVTRSEPVGGAQVHVRDLASVLLARGHHPVVLTGGSGPYIDSLRTRGVEAFTLASLSAPINPYRDLRALSEVRALLRTLQPDLVSTHSSKAGIVGRLAARSLGVPAIFTAHGWAFTPGVPSREAMVYRWIERMAAPLAAKIITVSEFDRQLALDRGIAPSTKVVTIHNGMPDVKQQLRADPARAPVRLTMIARFEPQKDHATLLRALSGLLDDPWELDLIGDGPLLTQAETLSRELGMADRVHFLGQRTDVDERLAETQVALLISNWEGFPRSILEAMRAGLPVVASAVGGIAESVHDGKTGFTVPPGDVQALRQLLKRLLNNPDLRLSMGRTARKLYEENFTLKDTVEKTVAVYNEVVGAPEN